MKILREEIDCRLLSV